MKPFRNRLRDALAPLIPAVQVALILAASIGNVLIAAAIFLNAKRLGALFLPALALYFILLTVLLAAILRRRELDRLHDRRSVEGPEGPSCRRPHRPSAAPHLRAGRGLLPHQPRHCGKSPVGAHG